MNEDNFERGFLLVYFGILVPLAAVGLFRVIEFLQFVAAALGQPGLRGY